MIYILIPALVTLMGMTLYSLLRGLNAFRQTIDTEPIPTAIKRAATQAEPDDVGAHQIPGRWRSWSS